MTINLMKSIITVVVVAACTFLTRVIPFILFGRGKQVPKHIRYLGEILPPAIIAILVVYCLKNMNFHSYLNYIPQIISICVIVILHIWKRNNLLSIGVGTAIYMILIQYVFV